MNDWFWQRFNVSLVEKGYTFSSLQVGDPRAVQTLNPQKS